MCVCRVCGVCGVCVWGGGGGGGGGGGAHGNMNERTNVKKAVVVHRERSGVIVIHDLQDMQDREARRRHS